MKHVFVKTSNYRRFMSAVQMLENRGAEERCLLPVVGKPGVGKTRVVDYWGSYANAVFIEGVPGMDLRYLKSALRAETMVSARDSFTELREMVEFFSGRKSGASPCPIILDECQHGFARKAECIEYLRRLAEKSGSILVLVCHTSESHQLDRYEHISTRVGCVATLLPPTIEDTAMFAREQCEVELDDAVVAQVHEQSNGAYRLIADALRNLERIADKSFSAG